MSKSFVNKVLVGGALSAGAAVWAIAPRSCSDKRRHYVPAVPDVWYAHRGLHDAGWMVENPKAAMYIWAKIPEPYAHLGSLEFAKKLLSDAKVCVSPGIGFGDYGDDHVRFALIENQDRIRQAVRGIKAMFRADGLMPATPARKTSAPHD